ncbi:MAG: glucosamine 6-phosphate synthetase, partial [Chloroflexi bacterium]|nr:glucosamine 6-phosphate synthetase [Chloroflexota bacterium]
MVPLFMAGDKQYFYYTNLVAAQNQVEVALFGENLLETTRFKSGFCGIAPQHDSEKTYSLSLGNKFQLLKYYGRQFLSNPAYINRTMLDTFGAYLSYYFISHQKNLNVFQYVRWEENKIVDLLINEYNWETAPDTTTTWRIGDGTAAFYNYIYYTLAGFSENDTFRSNQIREGMVSREEALVLSERENQPRYESIQWYCDVIGIDFADAINRINSAPKLYCI